MSEKLLGYNVQSGSVSDCLYDIKRVIASGNRKCRWLACINPHSYAVARSDPFFYNALLKAEWLVPDGIGIIVGARFLRIGISERITGFDIFEGVMRQLDQSGGRVFFLGSTDKTLSLIADRLKLDYPNVILAGTYSPPFKDIFNGDDLSAMVSAVNLSNADVLWVGMTAPKQEVLISQIDDRLIVDFAGAIGAVFDFYSGQVTRSNPLFQSIGLEWLPRLVREPRRLWRRMGVSAPIFLLDVLRARFGMRE